MLSDPVTKLKGIGEKLAADLALLDIYTIEDLLTYFPFRYDVFELKPLSQFIHEDTVTVVGKVLYDPIVHYYGKNKSRLTFTVEVEGVAVRAVMFNRAFAKKHIQPNKIVTLIGKWDAHRLQITVNNYHLGSPKTDVEIQPIYSSKGELTSNRLRKLIKLALDKYERQITEFLPPVYLEQYKLPTRKHAIKMLHFPKNQVELKHARRRLVYEELLLFQLKIQLLKKRNRLEDESFKQPFSMDEVRQFIERLPFTLTDDQRKSLSEILQDMKSPIQMNRLLQGDVGSGKTAVASICLYATVSADNQGAFMVPTEILAEQHYESLREFFKDDIRLGLLTSSVKGKKRELILEQIKNNDIDVVIGTHSLIQDEVVFNKLGLVIIDEQHRFGVEQRKALREKGLNPDVLFMTATPIPRTLAITALGDMDVSTIAQLPKGRKKVETYWIKENLFERVLKFMLKKVSEGEQAYVVSPLIEESEAFDYQNAVDLYEQLRAYFPPHIHIGLLHGKLHQDEKESIMKQFMNNDIQILVATTVIEVGVNVPNATMMVIYDAERFGLAQLHQLRGRVGRGEKQSYCILIADPKGEVGKRRMRIMTETNDGFKLAEEDLKLRGPGDFFGKKQSGLPEFKVADLVHDYKALDVARKDAVHIVRQNLLETDPAFEKLHAILQKETYEEPFD